MKIVVAGGTGFLGTPLCEGWAEEGHDVRVLTRTLPSGRSRHEAGTGVPGVTRVGWSPDGPAGSIAAILDGASVVINLAGESVADGRWTTTRKEKLRTSRLTATSSIATAMRSVSVPPPLFISASAVGYYGDARDAVVDEWSPPGHGFLADLCVEWEAEAQRATRDGVRVVLLRTGIVLERSGGALPKMARPFRMWIGGRLGSGFQFVSWIHRLDWIEMVRWIVETPALSGPVNATAPHPVTNAQLTRALGRALHRPALVPVPRRALKMLFGEMADSLLTGQRAIPKRALQNGFHFRYPEIDIALRGIFGD